ncbi:meiotic recombination [Lambiella insularis]|nr:meiotic recombination [Lambiella insularis]
MPALTASDTIRILISTDNHVGYNERDATRGGDAARTFHEIMCMAKERDVDMVLLAGDLFHDNNPSRQSMYAVMRSLRMNCYGEKPCELEMLSDPSECFHGHFNYVNYEDPDINVAIPVFSIHGNHDDPSGAGHLAALDVLQMSGLLNYYGRTPESDNILIKPVLLQKGLTKLALYGMSNVRDERLFRTFRDGKVKFFQPSTQKGDWFNIMSVHQNHHAHTATSYLPENFLPDFLDLVVWGHEHECLIDPRYNPEMNFHVMQPGSSVATSLMPGEAVPKHVAILSVTGRDFKVETIRLKTVRPFVIREIVLSEDKTAKKWAKMENHRTKLSAHLVSIVEEMIEEAKAEWLETQEDTEQDEEEKIIPLPVIRLRVEYSAPDGGIFDVENPQRFSNRFNEKVANTTDVVQFYRKKANAGRKAQNDIDMPDESVLAPLANDSVKVGELVHEFLTAQSLTILPQNSFGDAVSQYVDKDDKHAMEMFVNESLANQIKYLINMDQRDEDDDIHNAMDQYKSKLEQLFEAGHLKRARKARLKPKPDNWDTDIDGEWGEQPGALMRSDLEDGEDDDAASLTSTVTAAKGRGKAAPKKAITVAKKSTAAAAAAAKTTRGRKKVVAEESDEEEEGNEVVMVDDDDEDEESPLFVKPAAPARGGRKPAASKATPAPKRATARTAATQSKLNFSQPASQPSGRGKGKAAQGVSNDEISDDDDAFAAVPPTARSTRKR